MRGRIHVDHAAERLLGECKMPLRLERQAQCIHRLQIAWRQFRGPRKESMRLLELLAMQQHHALHGQQPGMIGVDARSQAREAVGFVQVALGQSQLSLQDIGAQLVGVDARRLLEFSQRLPRAVAGHQQGGALVAQAGVVRCEFDGAVQGCMGLDPASRHRQRQRQQPVRLRILGVCLDGSAGHIQALGPFCSAQDVDDLIVHGA